MPRRLEIEWRSGRKVAAAINTQDHKEAAALVLAHGAGGDFEGPLLAALAEGLAERGFSTLRFNFPYRQEGRRIPDPAPTLEECYRAVVAQARELFGPSPLILGGKSLGGRMASHLAAAGEEVAGLVLLGYPLHPPGRPEKLRDQHLFRIRAPMLFLSGTRDAFAQKDLLESVLNRLQPLATAHWLEAADHSFRAPRRKPAEAYREILEVVSGWLRGVVSCSGSGA